MTFDSRNEIYAISFSSRDNALLSQEYSSKFVPLKTKLCKGLTLVDGLSVDRPSLELSNMTSASGNAVRKMDSISETRKSEIFPRYIYFQVHDTNLKKMFILLKIFNYQISPL